MSHTGINYYKSTGDGLGSVHQSSSSSTHQLVRTSAHCSLMATTMGLNTSILYCYYLYHYHLYLTIQFTTLLAFTAYANIGLLISRFREILHFHENITTATRISSYRPSVLGCRPDSQIGLQSMS